MPSLLQMYQLARSGEKSRILPFLSRAIKDKDLRPELGIPGWQFRWLLKHLEQASSIDPQKIHQLRAEFDSRHWPEILENYLKGPSSDLYYGKPAAVFALDPETDRFKPHYKKILRQMKKEMVEIDSVWGWQTELSEQQRIDLGIVHGITGATLALSLIAKRLGQDPQIADLSKKLESSFQNIFKKGPIEEVRLIPKPDSSWSNGRIGWCSSDLSTGFALLIAGHRLKRPRLKKLGERFLDRAKKSAPSKLATDNPYLCHGSAGNAYILALAFELTGDRWFVNRSIQALEATRRYIDSEKFPLYAFPSKYQMMDLRNSSLVERSIKHGLDTSWDIVFGFRDPYDLSLL